MITKRWLKSNNACGDAIEWFDTQTDKSENALLNACITEKHLDWANWAMGRKLNKINCIRYAVYAARQVLDIFEKEYPNDDRPRKAIQAARGYIKNPTQSNKSITYTYAAADAAADAYAAYAAGAGYATAYAAARAAAYAASPKLPIKILKYGMRLLKTQ